MRSPPVLQKDPHDEDPSLDALYAVGTLAKVVHHLEPQQNLHHAVCQGMQRFRIVSAVEGYPFLAARIEPIAEPADTSAEVEALALQLRERTLELLQLLPSVPSELIHARQATRGPAQLADITASVLDADVSEKQALLETIETRERVRKLLPRPARSRWRRPIPGASSVPSCGASRSRAGLRGPSASRWSTSAAAAACWAGHSSSPATSKALRCCSSTT